MILFFMICTTCKNLSFQIICKKCQNDFLKPHFYQRKLKDDFFNYSFYALQDIEELLLSKYHFHGDRVFKILARLSFEKFTKNFTFTNSIFAVPIDDHTNNEFSHTAILAKSLKSDFIIPKYNVLKAKNKVKYAGKDLIFRQNNKRNFIVNNISNKCLVLCDDIVTSGLTILEAKEALEKNNNKVLFSLTLADAKL